jgi:hypothetical protein
METRAEQLLPTPQETQKIAKSCIKDSKKGHLPKFLNNAVENHKKGFSISLECIKETGLTKHSVSMWTGAKECPTNPWRKKDQQKFGPICIMENGNLTVTKPWRYIAIEIVKNNI